MISLTPRAAREIKGAQARKGISEFGLKLQVVGGGCEGYLYDLLFTDDPDPQDHVYESEGIKLFIDPRALPALEGTTIDHNETAYGTGLVFLNPRAKSRCACGASFST